jgi:ribonuclease P protein component
MAAADEFPSSVTPTALDSSSSASAPPVAGPPVAPPPSTTEWRLRKHADYQRVYKSSRKNFSSSMSYFYALRQAAPAEGVAPSRAAAPPSLRGPRVGLTAGKVLGNAVARNRIKRRMREAVRKHVATLTSDVDVILHPRNFVATIDFAKLEVEVARIFTTVQSTLDRQRERP